MFEDEPHEHEVRRHGDGEYGDRCQFATESDPEEEIEEHDMQQVIHQMRPAEAQSVLRRGLLLKREVGAQIVVHQKAYHVADGIGHVHLYPVLQYPIDGIVDGCRRGTHDAESDQFAQRFFLLHVAQFDGKVTEKSPYQRIFWLFISFSLRFAVFLQANTALYDTIEF